MVKTCIIETTIDNAPFLKAHLPAGVEVVDERFRADSGAGQLMLRGEGLPEWCRIGGDSPDIAMWAVAELLDDGTLRLIPGSGLPIEQVPEHLKAA